MRPDAKLAEAAREVCGLRGLTFSGLVGEGAFKQTFAANTATGTKVAIKVFRDGAASARTEREMHAMMRCAHPNIGTLIALDEVVLSGQRIVFTIEEFLSGGTLGAALGREGLLDRTALLALAPPLIDAVAHIASHRLVHRDIKPENILFRADGVTPVLVDFGIVRDLSRSPLTASWALQGPGTPFYAAPEQLTNERDLIDWRADQFALGVTLCVAHLGFHPYGDSGTSPGEAIANVANRDGPSDEAVRAIASSGLEPLHQMIRPWPVERFRKPASLAAAWSAL